jgi:trk system potassium uptake protein TrkA
MKAVVIGLGQFGHAAALALAKQGAHVVAIDVDMKFVDPLKEDVAMAVAADASDKASLEALDIADADVWIAAIGRNFEAQLLTVAYGRQLGVQRIVARAGTQIHAEILKEVGAHSVLNPEDDSARRLVQSLMLPGIESYVELAEGFSLVELEAPPGIVGKTLRELDFRAKNQINVVAIQTPTEGEGRRFNPVPDPEQVICAGDYLTVVGSDLDIAQQGNIMG